MKRKLILMVMAVTVLMTTACKKENATENKTPIDSIATKTKKVKINNQPVVAVPVDGKYPEMTFEKDVHDFGTINQGDKPTYDFKFENTGEADLLITTARGSCGCTVPEYPRTPIKVGETGTIKVSFDSKGKQGGTSKTVTIMCNTKEGSKILKINANIKVPTGTK